MNKPFDEIVPDTGFLVDSQIREALTQGYLIEPGTWDESQIRHASYQLRLGERVEIARARNASRIRRNCRSLNFQNLTRQLSLDQAIQHCCILRKSKTSKFGPWFYGCPGSVICRVSRSGKHVH